ncbi:NADP-dependent oxidoreductase [Streptomyces sp. WAC 04229]|uniref:NADP-dependent oxidoreductase n=1 Tax=Streptomyces sp. WAC 04229 TaxID=2203206 RepID=UPI000F742D34|nr:NADP-dependent oxidoreductase [Streptomyces sp. WAC 04229]
MRAVLSSGSAGVVVADVPWPEPGHHQVLVRVSAAGVNPVDVDAGRTGPFDRVLGWEAAGVAEAVGEDVRGVRVGDAVMGWTYWFSSGRGCQAQYCVLDASEVSAAPRQVDAAQAATVPLNGSTAWQALLELGVQPGESLLVMGAAGSIGGFAIDLAVGKGCEVWGVAAARDADFVGARGAHFVDRADALRGGGALPSGGVDAVLATAPVDEAWQTAVRPDGRFLSTVGQTLPRTACGFLNAHPDAGQLGELAQVVDSGELRTRVAQRYPLADAVVAYADAAAPAVRGRLVLTP